MENKKISQKNKHKFIIIIRHGEVDNPKRIVYNRDNLMKKEDIIHLSEKGKKQLFKLGLKLKNLKIKPIYLWVSPEIRAIESAKELRKSLNLPIEIKDELDEVKADGPYLAGIKINQWEKTGNPYDEKIWQKYQHENPGLVVLRMSDIFWQMAEKLKRGQAGILLSHGDPICWLVNYLIFWQIPDYPAAKKNFNPKKGEAIILILDKNNKILSYSLLT
ncbi:MAG: histidine phosphatase family protein [Microgenomates group bacterium]|nr:histidine phosphatase family protein [Microgenomates group bacterium]